jgi:hypothetical protein
MITEDLAQQATNLLTTAISEILEDALPEMLRLPPASGMALRAEDALVLGEDVAALGRAIGVLSRYVPGPPLAAR